MNSICFICIISHPFIRDTLAPLPTYYIPCYWWAPKFNFLGETRLAIAYHAIACYLTRSQKTFELKPLGFLLNTLKKLLNYSSLGNILPHHARIFKANSRVLAYNHGLTLYPEHIGLRTRHWVFGESATFFIMLFSSPSLMWDGLGWYILNPRRSSGLCKLSINRKSNSILNMLSAYYGGLEQSL